MNNEIETIDKINLLENVEQLNVEKRRTIKCRKNIEQMNNEM